MKHPLKNRHSQSPDLPPRTEATPSLKSLLFGLILLTQTPSIGCALYDPPPVPAIDGAENGLVPTGEPYLDIVFSEPIDENTLRLKVAPFITTDGEGNLGDEDASAETELITFFTHDPEKGQTGGIGQINKAKNRFRITPDKPFPVGPKLVVLIEKGLADQESNDTGERTRLLFAYRLQCGEGAATTLPSGPYFFLFDIEKPVPVQIQIFADVRINAETGSLLAQFTGADRNPDPNRCPSPCKDTEACSLVPTPECVLPSLKASSLDEYSDFITNPDPPTGYSFTVVGCAKDGPDGSIGIVTQPTDLIVQKPPVEAIGLAISCSFTKDEKGTLRCTGSSGSTDVKIGGESAGPAEGSSQGRIIPIEDASKDLPAPPE